MGDSELFFSLIEAAHAGGDVGYFAIVGLEGCWGSSAVL
jgi:hypothetical protein